MYAYEDRHKLLISNGKIVLVDCDTMYSCRYYRHYG